MNKIPSVFYILTTLIVCTIIFLTIYSGRGRLVIYNDEKRFASGLGKKIVEVPDMFMIKRNNTEDDLPDIKMVTTIDIEKYNLKEYARTFIPAHSTVSYVVGYFKGWENIPGLDDKYLSIDEGNEVIGKYRLVLESNKSLNWLETSFGVEEMINFSEQETIPLKQFKPRLYGWNFEKIKKIIKLGDVVIIRPQRGESGKAVLDRTGVVLSETIVLRRTFGSIELNLETLF